MASAAKLQTRNVALRKLCGPPPDGTEYRWPLLRCQDGTRGASADVCIGPCILMLVAREPERAQMQNYIGIITLAGVPQNRGVGLACHRSRSFEKLAAMRRICRTVVTAATRRAGESFSPWRARRRSRRRS